MFILLRVSTVLAVVSACARQPEHEKCPTSCPKLPVEPVCDNQGRLHTNKCHLNLISCKLNHTIRQVEWLECEFSDCEDQACFNNIDPICGSDNVLYNNQCYLLLASCGKKAPVTSSTKECQ